jgi:hypothetical protein
MPYADKEKERENRRRRARLKRGTPLDAPVEHHRVFRTAEERRLAKNERARRAYAKSRNMTPEQIAARNAEKNISYEERMARRKAKQAEYSREYHQKRKGDPEYRAKMAAKTRARYLKIASGEHVETRPRYATEEERLEARRLARRKSCAKRRGTTIEEIQARTAERLRAKAERERLRLTETPEQRRQRQAEKTAAKTRAAKRSHMTKTVMPKARADHKPVNANDPPELIELFRKASKGEPPMAHNPKVRKISVFSLRGVNFGRVR